MGTCFVLDFTETPKIHGLSTETGVLGFVPLGGVSGGLGVRLFVDQTAGRLFSAHSKPGVT